MNSVGRAAGIDESPPRASPRATTTQAELRRAFDDVATCLLRHWPNAYMTLRQPCTTEYNRSGT